MEKFIAIFLYDGFKNNINDKPSLIGQSRKIKLL